jgi:hypothetical protein
MIASGVYDMVLDSRTLSEGALSGGMPQHKYIANLFLTAFQSVFLGVKLSEYHWALRYTNSPANPFVTSKAFHRGASETYGHH